MRVLIINTSEKTGGAAVAARRLTAALSSNGVQASMLVMKKESDDPAVEHLGYGPLQRWRFVWERLVVWLYTRWPRKQLFTVDIANTGTDITGRRDFREADVVHLHWVNQGMLSTSNIKKILKSGKPVVWTMHDAWPATAICHYTRGCARFKTRCQQCPLLPHPGDNDLAARTWRRKQQMLSNELVYFVTCSRWLEGFAKQSALLRGHRIKSIPNCIDVQRFRPIDRQAARQAAGLPAEGRIILFVSQRVTDERKGMRYFIEAINRLTDEHPEWLENTGVAVLGGSGDEVAAQLPLKTYPLGYVGDEQQIVNIYNAADVFVIPSMEDNLPNTIMEAMACGVPSVGFKVGGIPEMIEHQKNGYVAEPRRSSDLAHGISWVLDEADPAQLREACLRKVAHNYSQSSVAMRYIEVYNEAIAMKHFRL